MPTRLDIPHSRQEDAAGCLGACVQMVLRYWGIDQSQTALNRLLGLTSIGTPYSNIRRLSALKIAVTLQSGDDADLRSALDRNLPVIVFLFTGALPDWEDNTSHAVVIVGYDEAAVFIHDPAFVEAPRQVAWNAFLLAWSEQDYTYAIIQPQD